MASHAEPQSSGSPVKKELLLNAFVMTTPGHLSPGLWKHPRNQTENYNKLTFWTSLAQKLDAAGFHAMFIADTLGPYDVYKGPANVDPALASGAQFPVNDPLYAVPAMAAATKNLIFGVTASTTYDPPYALARRFSTVDHLAEGRVAWNIVTSYLESAAKNFGLETQIEHDERYRIANEYMDVVYKVSALVPTPYETRPRTYKRVSRLIDRCTHIQLWESSWRDDAAVRDKQNGQFAVAGRVRQINHQGKYFKVPGPHICEPSPQRTPFLFQAGTSKAGTDFGAKHAEAVFMGAQLPELVKASVDALRATARDKFGRNPDHIKVFTGISIIVDETDEKAKAKYEELLSYGDREGALALFGGWTGHDLSGYTDDEDFRFSDKPAIRSIVHRWASTVPGSEGKAWTKATIAEFLLLGGMM